jgi:hypothetical protein
MRSFTRRVLPRVAAVFTSLALLAAVGAGSAMAASPWAN